MSASLRKAGRAKEEETKRATDLGQALDRGRELGDCRVGEDLRATSRVSAVVEDEKKEGRGGSERRTHQERLDDLVLGQRLHDARDALEDLDELGVVDLALEPAEDLDEARDVPDEDLAVGVAQASKSARRAGHELGLLQAGDHERNGLKTCVGVSREPRGVGADEAEGGRAEGGERALRRGEAAEDRGPEQRREVGAERRR